jgi:N-acetylglutamate synthase-like GNAT family acetyltransferase
MKITSLLESIRDKDKEHQLMIKENNELRKKVDEFLIVQHQSDNQKLSQLAQELEKKDEEMRNIVHEKSKEIHELKVNPKSDALDCT